MNLFNSVTAFLKGEKKTIEAPEGVCPNCWGRQEYQGKMLEAVRHEHIDLNNVNEKKGWIQAYATQNFEGITADGQPKECPSCKLTYE